MNKQEALQTHRLLMNIVKEVTSGFDSSDVSFDDLKEYQNLETRPQHIFKKTSEHEEAILTLSGELRDAISDKDSTEEGVEENEVTIEAEV